MNIQILDSWLREYLETKATPEQIGDALSLTSISAEKIVPFGKGDVFYDFEVTTNRPDLMSVIAIAREAATVLKQEGIPATFKSPHPNPLPKVEGTESIKIINDPKLANRILGVVMEVNLKESPEEMKNKLLASDHSNFNNLIDITNYVMHETGHPTHVFDFDRLNTKKLIIREAKPGEEIVTLDGKSYKLAGGDIIAEDDNGRIVDLLGVMGLENSVVTDKTKRIFFFIDDLDPHKIRKTSMTSGIRTDAAILNEKGLDPELSYQAFLRGIELFQKHADGKIISDIIDVYPNKPKTKQISVSIQQINDKVGIDIPKKTSIEILENLGFDVTEKNDVLTVTIPSIRNDDMNIPEDVIEEVARIYGYHNIPPILPSTSTAIPYNQSKDPFYWEAKAKHTLKDWGFTEVYTYSMVSEVLLESKPEDAVTLQNPLTDDGVYMRTTLTPSLIQTVEENSNHERIKIFEVANVYKKRKGDLPEEIRMLAGVTKSSKFLEVKGVIEQLFEELGIKNYSFKQSQQIEGAEISIGKSKIGSIEILESMIISFEINFEEMLQHVSSSKIYQPISKFPPIIEDVRITVSPETPYEKIVSTIKGQSNLVSAVELLDVYEDKKTFRIFYQDKKKNLTNEDIKPIREKILSSLRTKLKAKIS